MTALLGPQEVAGTTDFEIAPGDTETGTELGELADGVEPLARFEG